MMNDELNISEELIILTKGKQFIYHKPHVSKDNWYAVWRLNSGEWHEGPRMKSPQDLIAYAEEKGYPLDDDNCYFVNCSSYSKEGKAYSPSKYIE